MARSMTLDSAGRGGGMLTDVSRAAVRPPIGQLDALRNAWH
jgi:hypothetical protein